MNPERDVAALMAQLRRQVAVYADQLGFPIGSIVKFTEEAQREDHWPNTEWIVTGAIRFYSRIELDTWPKTNTYTAIEADRLVLVRASATETTTSGRRT